MSFFLRHFGGFLIQIGGGMLLSLIPFSDETFRYPKKRVLWGYGMLVVCFSLGFPLLMKAPILAGSHWRTMAANGYMLLTILILTGLYFFVVRTQMVKKLVVLVLVLFYAATQYLLVNLASPLFPDGVLPDVYPPLTLALYGVTALVLFPLTALMMLRSVRPYLQEIEPGNIHREFWTLLAATALYFMLLVVYSSRPDGLLMDYWWWIVPPMLLAAAVLGLFYWSLFRESVRRKRDADARKTLEIQSLQYETITREMEQTRQARHDMRHILNRLADLLSREEVAEAQAYLTELGARTAKRETVCYCRNSTVNSLLQYYTGLAADRSIHCEVTANCGEIPVSPVDMTVLLGNALENAIHACEALPENRWISVQIGTIGDTLAIQISNACKEVHPAGQHRMEGSFLPASAFLSTRPGGGYGLGSIAHTAQKYGGDARFRYQKETKTFTTRIRLELHAEWKIYPGGGKKVWKKEGLRHQSPGFSLKKWFRG